MKTKDLEDQVMIAILPVIYQLALDEHWYDSASAADKWVEKIGQEAYSKARRIIAMKDARVK